MSGSEPTEQSNSAGPVTTQAVRTALDSVLDPELDRSIVELEYIEDITIEQAPSGSETSVRMAFLLPTAWCSPAFAWMMATDAKSAIESISGVDSAEVVLRDHMHETEINTGVNEGESFAAAFPEADGGLESVRATLDHKARLARQYDAVETLLAAGLSPTQIVALTPADLDRDTADDRIHIYLDDRSFGISVDAEPIEEYLEMATAEGCLTGETDPLFRMPDGEPIDESMFELLRRRTRSAKVNVNSQGTVCDALNESRREMLDGTGE